jgi:hypothetical protein
MSFSESSERMCLCSSRYCRANFEGRISTRRSCVKENEGKVLVINFFDLMTIHSEIGELLKEE